MAETEHITVAEISEGHGGTGDPGQAVSLPVVELLTGRGFVTGKSGSGKSNTASVIAEKLLDNGFGLLIVDIDGEYYGLKEEYEILHAGADEECDVQVTEDHAGRLATLALEQNVPIILDVSSFLDEGEAERVLTAVARHLFAKAKKQKQPFLLLVEEVHEYIPEGGSIGECGKMLIKIGKRGRKHGLGIVGISQRPADVKKDFITQCDWLVWHRLTWDNDTNVVKRVLDAEYASAVEELDDGEGFLMTDWSGTIRRVQFQRKRTFDAGATPGLEDFERPELKSVSDDLVSELESIREETQAREDRIAELREQLDQKNSRIAELERELQDARDLSRMADQFVDALLDEVDGQNPGRTEKARLRDRRVGGGSPSAEESDPDDQTATDGESDDGEFSAEKVLGRLRSVVDAPGAAASDGGETAPVAAGGETAGTDAAADRPSSGEPADPSRDSSGPDGSDGTDRTDAPTEGEAAGEDAAEEIIDADAPPAVRNGIEGDGSPSQTEIIDGERPLAVRELTATVAGLQTRARRMLAFYAEVGPATPLAAHDAAGGSGDRTSAYAHNRTLRTEGLIEHVGRGRYDYRLRETLGEELGDDLDPEVVEAYADRIEQRALGSSAEPHSEASPSPESPDTGTTES